MTMMIVRALLGAGLAAAACIAAAWPVGAWDEGAGAGASSGLHDPRERHLARVRQLTFGGQNAEGYFSPDGARIIFQATRPPFACDQIFVVDADGGEPRLVSTGKGRATCAFFFPDGRRFVYASTHLAQEACPPPPDRSRGYVWPLYPGYDIFVADLDGGPPRRLTDNPRYDAEAAVSPDGKRIVFTSLREGDLDLYLMNADGTGLRRLTDRPGFDGGAFFSWDGRFIVYRSHYPETAEALEEYRALLAQDLMKPVRAEIFYMKADGSDPRQVTRNGHANWAPFMHPDGRRIIFSSNLHDPGSGNFSLYLVNLDGTGLERVTFGARFDSFPMFSRDGKRLVFTSTRNARQPGEFNLFVADWVP